jgi:pSer/pThr/pTyr-binding forkhead associated (FHA) protein
VLLVALDHEIPLAPGRYVIGREPNAAVWIDSTRVSRRHAVITVSGSGAAIEDLGSKNGTFVNGARLRGRAPLGDRDEIDLGPERVVVRVRRAADSTETQAG